jgi:hypothetical protein
MPAAERLIRRSGRSLRGLRHATEELKKKINPFKLRRLKSQVATELPVYLFHNTPLRRRWAQMHSRDLAALLLFPGKSLAITYSFHWHSRAFEPAQKNSAVPRQKPHPHPAFCLFNSEIPLNARSGRKLRRFKQP